MSQDVYGVLLQLYVLVKYLYVVIVIVIVMVSTEVTVLAATLIEWCW